MKITTWEENLEAFCKLTWAEKVAYINRMIQQKELKNKKNNKKNNDL